MMIPFSTAECLALKATFGSWDWSGRPRSTSSGDEHYRRVHALIAYSPTRGVTIVVSAHEWPLPSVKLLISLIRSTLAKPDHSHGCKTQYRKPVKNKRTRAALRKHERALIRSLPVVDALAELA